jgi:hypothetical protein
MSLDPGAIRQQGASDKAVPPTGYPIFVSGWDGTNEQALLTDTSGALAIAGNAVYNNDAAATTAVGISLQGAAASTRPLATLEYAVNAAGTYDRWRNNADVTLISSGAQTTAQQSASQTNYNGGRVIVFLNVTAASGTGGLQLTIQGKDPTSGNWVNLTTLPTAVTATGMYVYELAPGDGAASGGVTQRTAGYLPRTWRVNIAVGDSSSYTYSVGASVGAA